MQVFVFVVHYLSQVTFSNQIHVPRLGDIVDSCIGLLPASVSSLAGRYDNPMPELTLSHQPGTMNLATEPKV